MIIVDVHYAIREKDGDRFMSSVGMLIDSLTVPDDFSKVIENNIAYEKDLWKYDPSAREVISVGYYIEMLSFYDNTTDRLIVENPKGNNIVKVTNGFLKKIKEMFSDKQLEVDEKFKDQRYNMDRGYLIDLSLTLFHADD